MTAPVVGGDSFQDCADEHGLGDRAEGPEDRRLCDPGEPPARHHGSTRGTMPPITERSL